MCEARRTGEKARALGWGGVRCTTLRHSEVHQRESGVLKGWTVNSVEHKEVPRSARTVGAETRCVYKERVRMLKGNPGECVGSHRVYVRRQSGLLPPWRNVVSLKGNLHMLAGQDAVAQLLCVVWQIFAKHLSSNMKCIK